MHGALTELAHHAGRDELSLGAYSKGLMSGDRCTLFHPPPMLDWTSIPNQATLQVWQRSEIQRSGSRIINK
jgi:hypothetical protein